MNSLTYKFYDILVWQNMREVIDATLAKIEELINKPLPMDFRNFHASISGEQEFFGYTVYNLWYHIGNISTYHPPESKDIILASWPINAIKLVSYNVKWLPLFGNGRGKYIGMDLDPGENGTEGQIIVYGRYITPMLVVANSLEEFFDLMIKIIKDNKNYPWEDHTLLQILGSHFNIP